MAAPLRRGRALARQRLLGLVFLVLVGLLVGLTVGIYQKRFTPVDTVLLRADRAGNQLTPGADVKVRGLIVGEVRRISSTGNGAVLELALEPDRTGLVPRDVRARLLPKTLFGEKFVALVASPGPVRSPLRDGDVIGQDRSETARETERVLSNLVPLLETLRPEALSTTLNALSGALRGRGEAVGANAERTADYLRRLNPELPAIQENLRRLARLSEDYDATAQDLLAVLDNSAALGRNLVDQRAELAAFLAATRGSTGELDGVLRENEQRLVRLAADSLPSLQVYARYAPEFPCLAAALVEAESEVSATFGGRQPGLHITLSVVRDNGPYVAGDEPRNGDDPGPTCRGLPPNPREIPFPVYRNADDGYRDGQPVNPRTGEFGEPTSQPGPGARAAAADPARFLSGQDLLTRAVVGAVTGTPMDEVPDLAGLLFGPVARGTTVSLR